MMRSALVLLAICAASCAASAPAPIAYGGGAGPARAPARIEQRAPVQAAPRPHQETQTPDWADGPGTPLSAYALQPDEAQPYDPANPPRTHRMAANETLFDVATAYQIPLRALIDQNRLEPPYAIAPGREIQLPPPRLHRVARGESFEDIARRYNVDLRSLGLLNRMRAPYAVREGDAIVLPALARAPVETETPPPIVQTPSPAPPSGAARFAWPVRGEILARFGPQAGGVRLDGIEIAAQEGAPIVAAADGDVVYAGTDLAAYGALVLIRHADNYVTAYGYGRQAFVRVGQRVRQGERIADVGRVGSKSPRLLFQVRQGTEAVDPSPLLGAR